MGSLSVLAVALVALTSCNKEEITQDITNETGLESDGSPKALANFVRFMGGTAPKWCNVQRGNYYNGHLIGGGGVSGAWKIQTSPAGFMYVDGDSDYPYCSGTDPGYCLFERPTTLGTFSPYYYITPNQNTSGATTKILRVRLKGGVSNPTSGTFFEYKVSANTWTNVGGANTATYFEWAIVTSKPNPIGC